MIPTVAHPVTYSFNDQMTTTTGTLRIEAENLGHAFDQLPHMNFSFIEAVDANGVRVYG